MPVGMKIVAQYAMDEYLSNYRSESDFFDLSDFVFACSATLGEFYRQEFLSKYSELRQEKKDEIVSFNPDVLSEVQLKVEKKDNKWYAEMTEKTFSFPFEQNSAGFQYVFASKPAGACELQRTSLGQLWQTKHFPYSNTIFWYPSSNKINFVCNGVSNLSEVTVFYVPAIGENMLVPDALVQMVVNTTAGNKKGLQQAAVVKSSADLNPNKILQTEINKSAL